MECIVKPGAKTDSIVLKDKVYYVALKAKPVEGKANLALVKLFKKELGLRVRVKRGLTSKKKVLEII
ncbi:DUF167 domain-containing protein [archaeon]|jgi:uncharacterized protein (TIGR00251 family)|nr:DUF167 domain-containing protein [archaeon]MBT4417263.1 DUF167 domain-containing protein [archaeon]